MPKILKMPKKVPHPRPKAENDVVSSGRRGLADVVPISAERDESSETGQGVTLLSILFKHNAARHHRIPKARLSVRNGTVDKAMLKQRDDLTL